MLGIKKVVDAIYSSFQILMRVEPAAPLLPSSESNSSLLPNACGLGAATPAGHPETGSGARSWAAGGRG